METKALLTKDNKRKYTAAEYLAMEIDSDIRHEFYQGEILEKL
ncbi:Uma2 family endonuclease [Paraflavitalea devenefica]|nr:Uma2 family endonuclease [Paraflavitalea devenefica]